LTYAGILARKGHVCLAVTTRHRSFHALKIGEYRPHAHKMPHRVMVNQARNGITLTLSTKSVSRGHAIEEKTLKMRINA